MTMINKNMIILARESRGITQLELADKIGMSRPNLGKIESGDIGVKEDTLNTISEVTHYPVSFFSQDNEVYPEHLTYRKKDNVPQAFLTPINAKVNIIRMQIQYLLNMQNIKNPELPYYEVTEKDTPQIIAQKVRREWKLDKPVIEDVIKLLEQKGIAIASFNFGTERVDSRCALTETKFPIIIYNRSQLGDRQRFSLAYQLGHLVMHTMTKVSWERDISHEANLFAAEFLMPEKEIRKDFANGITLPLLGELKLKWKASMISILYRADDLGFLTPNQKKYLIQQFNEQKMRRREPLELDVPIESPNLVRKWIAELKAKQKLDVTGIASLLHLNKDEFIELYS